MLRPVITATALVALAGSSFAFAQHGFGSGAGDDQPRFEQRHHLSAADVSAFADARIAALKAGLQLTPDQAKNWPPFEQAVRDLVQLRIERLQARQAGEQQPQGTPFERLSRRADSMAKSSAALKKIEPTPGAGVEPMLLPRKRTMPLVGEVQVPAVSDVWPPAEASTVTVPWLVAVIYW